MNSKTEEDRRRVEVTFLMQVIWPAFLGAIVGVGVLFSLIDPSELTVVVHQLEGSRMGAYTIGFLCLWSVLTLACALTWYLIRTDR
ncbi:MAG: hypothetical protein AAF499_17785 [Pseudomonadota bacterium]